MSSEAAKFSWIMEIQKGDILMEGDTPRVVREVSHFNAYTIINSSDLKQRRFRPSGKRVTLSLDIDKSIEAEFRKYPPFGLTCCDVEGIG